MRGWQRNPVVVTAIAFACLLGANTVLAQSAGPVPHVPGTGMHEAAAATPPLLLEWASHVLVGGAAAMLGVFAHRAWSRRRWRRAPAATVTEAVLAVDLVNSTRLATRHGESLAMRARNVLERRALAAAQQWGVTFVENTGDGCMMTFASAVAAAQAATKLLRGLHERPPDMAPGPPLEVRAAVTYGEILLDAKGARHGATINEAFRLMGVATEDFVAVDGEARLEEIPDRNRVFLDEDAVNELKGTPVAFRQAGVCRLKGFTGFHRVYELRWTET